jgi:prepilin-type N-terminal cleavage/methylation domain-containing protein/prepilin-type processing-associated H-X9-DG protein
MSPRRAFTLVELVVVIAIIGLLVAMLIPAVQQSRQSAARVQCENHLRQLGIALHHYHEGRSRFPPGIVSDDDDLGGGDSTGFTQLLPFFEDTAVHDRYDFTQVWYAAANYDAVGKTIEILLCPANTRGSPLDLNPFAQQWALAMPPTAGHTDYAFSKGTNAALAATLNMPVTLRGVFDVNSEVRLEGILDGTSNTIALGDAAAGGTAFRIRDLNQPSQPAVDLLTGRPHYIQQAWAAGCTANTGHPYYGSVLAATAQYGHATNPRDEPMNPPGRLVAPTMDGGDTSGDNTSGRDWVSGFRSLHPGGCNFLFCDGSVRYVRQTVSATVYRAISTYAGGEAVQAGVY